MVLNRTVDPLLERLIVAWHDAEAIRDMPELFSEDKLAQNRKRRHGRDRGGLGSPWP